MFNNQIRQLVHSFPPDHTTSEGKPFWSGVKRLPKAISYSPDDPVHAEFILSAANIFAAILGVPA